MPTAEEGRLMVLANLDASDEARPVVMLMALTHLVLAVADANHRLAEGGQSR